MKHLLSFPIAIGLLLTIVSSCTHADPASVTPPVIPVVEDTLVSIPIPQTDSLEIAAFLRAHPDWSAGNDLQEYYGKRDFRFAWFNEYGLREEAGFFLNLVQHIGEEGISDTAKFFHETEVLFTQLGGTDYAYVGKDSLNLQLELLLTGQFFAYADRVWNGLSESTSRSLQWYIKRKQLTYGDLLDSLLVNGPSAFGAGIHMIAQYDMLQHALESYTALGDTTWPLISPGIDKTKLVLGDSSAEVLSIQERLLVLGDLDSLENPGVFDQATDLAVRKFQYRHGLVEDGEAGKAFFGQINISPKDRALQIRANMERCRWVPSEPQGDYIMVNIPEFKMHVYEHDSLVFSMNTIVGKTSSSTIIFNDELEYIVFSPYWVVPSSIIQGEIVPAMIKDPAYLARNHMEVYDLSSKEVIPSSGIHWAGYSGGKFPYGIRQRPGAFNSLGWVKFLFPNQYYIYFHDTPSRDLFNRNQRSFSHGCIRLAEPQKLAQYLLRNDSLWPVDRIDSVMHGGVETYVKLPAPIPVFIAYFTAWVDEYGFVQFRQDIYDHDKALKPYLEPAADNKKIMASGTE